MSLRSKKERRVGMILIKQVKIRYSCLIETTWNTIAIVLLIIR